jgi:hypothetical protein
MAGLLRPLNKAPKRKQTSAALNHLLRGMAKRKEQSTGPVLLKGWAQIARFLELPVSTAHSWAKLGMPVRREGRYVVASTEDLTKWLNSNREGSPTTVVNSNSDLATELRRSLKALND